MKKRKMIFITSVLYGLMFSSCTLKPLAYQPETIPPFAGPTQLNEKLVASEKI